MHRGVPAAIDATHHLHVTGPLEADEGTPGQAQETTASHDRSFVVSVSAESDTSVRLARTETNVPPPTTLLALQTVSSPLQFVSIVMDEAGTEDAQTASEVRAHVGTPWQHNVAAALECLRRQYDKTCMVSLSRWVRLADAGLDPDLAILSTFVWMQQNRVKVDDERVLVALLPDEQQRRIATSQLDSFGGLTLGGVHYRVHAPLLAAIAGLGSSAGSAVLASTVATAAERANEMRYTVEYFVSAHDAASTTSTTERASTDHGLLDVFHSLSHMVAPCADLLDVMHTTVTEGNLPASQTAAALLVYGALLGAADRADRAGKSRCSDMDATRAALARGQSYLAAAVDVVVALESPTTQKRTAAGVGPTQHPHAARLFVAALGNMGSSSDQVINVLTRTIKSTPDPHTAATAVHALRTPLSAGHAGVRLVLEELAASTSHHELVVHRAGSLLATRLRHERPLLLKHKSNVTKEKRQFGDGEDGEVTSSILPTVSVGPVGYDKSWGINPGSDSPKVGADMLASSALNIEAGFGGETYANVRIHNQAYLKVNLFGFRLTVIEVLFSFEHEFSLNFNLISSLVNALADGVDPTAFLTNKVSAFSGRVRTFLDEDIAQASDYLSRVENTLDALPATVTNVSELVSDVAVLSTQFGNCTTQDPAVSKPNASDPDNPAVPDANGPLADEAASLLSELGDVVSALGDVKTFANESKGALVQLETFMGSLVDSLESFAECPALAIQSMFGLLADAEDAIDVVRKGFARAKAAFKKKAKAGPTDKLSALASADAPWRVANLVNQTCDVGLLIPDLLKEWEKRMWCTQKFKMLGNVAGLRRVTYVPTYAKMQYNVVKTLKYVMERYRGPAWRFGYSVAPNEVGAIGDITGLDKRVVYPELRLLDRNRNVVALKLLLRYRLGRTNVDLTPEFDRKTHARVLEFQQLVMKDADASGVVNRATWEALMPGGVGLPIAERDAMIGANETVSRVILDYGSDAIRAVQLLLNKYTGHLSMSGLQPQTCTAAEQAFCAPAQRSSQMEVILWNATSRRFYKTIPDNRNQCTTRYVCMQFSHWAPGIMKVNGRFDLRLSAAIRRFQYKVGLYPSGTIDAFTFAELLWATEDHDFTVENVYATPYHEYLWDAWSKNPDARCKPPPGLAGLETGAFATELAMGLAVILPEPDASYLDFWLTDNSYNLGFEQVQKTDTHRVYKYTGGTVLYGKSYETDGFIQRSKRHLLALVNMNRALKNIQSIEPGQATPDPPTLLELTDVSTTAKVHALLADAPLTGGWVGSLDENAKVCQKSTKGKGAKFADMKNGLTRQLNTVRDALHLSTSPQSINDEFVDLLSQTLPDADEVAELGAGFEWTCVGAAPGADSSSSPPLCQTVDRRPGTCAAVSAEIEEKSELLEAYSAFGEQLKSMKEAVDALLTIKREVKEFLALMKQFKDWAKRKLGLGFSFHFRFPNEVRNDNGCGTGKYSKLSSKLKDEGLVILSTESRNNVSLPSWYKSGVQVAAESNAVIVTPVDIVGFDCRPILFYCDLWTARKRKGREYKIRINNVLPALRLPANFTSTGSRGLFPGFAIPEGIPFAKVVPIAEVCSNSRMYLNGGVQPTCCNLMASHIHVSVGKPSSNWRGNLDQELKYEDPTPMLPKALSATAFALRPISNTRFVEVMNVVLMDQPLLSLSEISAAKDKATSAFKNKKKKKSKRQVGSSEEFSPVSRECLNEDGAQVKGECIGSLANRVPIVDKVYTLYETRLFYIVGPVPITIKFEVYGRLTISYAIEFCPMDMSATLQIPAGPSLGISASICIALVVAEGCIRLDIDVVQVLAIPSLNVQFGQPSVLLDPYVGVEIRLVTISVFAELCCFTCDCSGFLDCDCDYMCDAFCSWSTKLVSIDIPSSGGPVVDLRIPANPPSKPRPRDRSPALLRIFSASTTAGDTPGIITIDFGALDPDTGITWLEASVFPASLDVARAIKDEFNNVTSSSLYYTRAKFPSVAAGSSGRDSIDSSTRVLDSFQLTIPFAEYTDPALLEETGECSQAIVLLCVLNGADAKSCDAVPVTFAVQPPTVLLDLHREGTFGGGADFSFDGLTRQVTPIRFTNEPQSVIARLALSRYACDESLYNVSLFVETFSRSGIPSDFGDDSGPYSTILIGRTEAVAAAEDNLPEDALLLRTKDDEDAFRYAVVVDVPTDPELETAEFFRVTVEVTTVSGREFNFASDFVAVDLEQPDLSQLRAFNGPSGLHTRVTVTAATLDICVGGAVDSISGIAKIEWESVLDFDEDVARYGSRRPENPAGSLATAVEYVDVETLRSFPSPMNTATIDVPLTCYERPLPEALLSGAYYHHLRVTDVAGNFIVATSAMFSIDGEPPYSLYITSRAGLVNDSETAIFTFAFADRHSGVRSTEVTLGRFVGDEVWAGVRRLTAAERDTGEIVVRVADIGEPDEDVVIVATFYVVDEVGNTAELHSPVLVFDRSPPTTGPDPLRIGDEALPSAAFWGIGHMLRVYAVDWRDADSALDTIEFALHDGLSDTLLDSAFIVATDPDQTTFQLDWNTTLSVEGGSYYVAARANNTKGLINEWISSAPFVLDTTPPDVDSVFFVRSEVDHTETSFTANVAQVTVAHAGLAEDSYDSVVRAVVQVVDEGNGVVLVDATLSPITPVLTMSTTLAQDATYSCNVRFVNGAGLEKSVDCTGTLYVDTSPPSSGTVTSALFANFGARAAQVYGLDEIVDLESGVVSVVVDATHLSSGTQLLAPTVVPPSALAAPFLVGPFMSAIAPGDVIQIRVVSTNGADIDDLRSFDVVNDNTPCSAAAALVLDGSIGLDADIQIESSSLSISFSGFTDDLEPQDQLVFDWRPVELSSGTPLRDWTRIAGTDFVDVAFDRVTELPLSLGGLYGVQARCINVAGDSSNIVTSDGVEVVLGFGAGIVRDGPVSGSDIDVTTGVDTACVNFDEFPGGLHGVAHYEWALGTVPGLSDVGEWRVVRPAGALAACRSANLPLNTRVFASVLAVANYPALAFTRAAGLTSPDSADGTYGRDSAVGSSTGFLVRSADGGADIRTLGKPVFGRHELTWALSNFDTLLTSAELRLTVGNASVSRYDSPRLELQPDLTVSLVVPLSRDFVPSGTIVVVELVLTQRVGGTVTFSDTVLVDDTTPDSGRVTLCGESRVVSVPTGSTQFSLCCLWDRFGDRESPLGGYDVSWFRNSLALTGASQSVGAASTSASAILPLDPSDREATDEYSCAVSAVNFNGVRSATIRSRIGARVIAEGSVALATVDDRLPLFVPISVAVPVAADAVFVADPSAPLIVGVRPAAAFTCANVAGVPLSGSTCPVACREVLLVVSARFGPCLDVAIIDVATTAMSDDGMVAASFEGPLRTAGAVEISAECTTLSSLEPVSLLPPGVSGLPIQLDTTPPSVVGTPRIFNGDTELTSVPTALLNGDSLNISVILAAADAETGISSVSVGATAGSAERSDDLLAFERQTWRAMDASTDSARVSMHNALDIEAGVSFRVALRVTNGAGETAFTLLDSPVIIIDIEPPRAGQVNDGSLAARATDAAQQRVGAAETAPLLLRPSGSPVEVYWRGFTEFESGIDYFEWSIDEGVSVVTRDFALSTIAVQLIPEVPVVVSVRAVDLVGHASEWAQSPGQLTSLIAPEGQGVFSGPVPLADQDVEYAVVADNASVTVSWLPFQLAYPDSDMVVRYTIEVSASAFDGFTEAPDLRCSVSPVATWEATVVATGALAGPLIATSTIEQTVGGADATTATVFLPGEVADGTELTIVVRATNVIDLESSPDNATLTGVLVDASAPEVGEVRAISRSAFTRLAAAVAVEQSCIVGDLADCAPVLPDELVDRDTEHVDVRGADPSTLFLAIERMRDPHSRVRQQWSVVSIDTPVRTLPPLYLQALAELHSSSNFTTFSSDPEPPTTTDVTPLTGWRTVPSFNVTAALDLASRLASSPATAVDEMGSFAVRASDSGILYTVVTAGLPRVPNVTMFILARSLNEAGLVTLAPASEPLRLDGAAPFAGSVRHISPAAADAASSSGDVEVRFQSSTSMFAGEVLLVRDAAVSASAGDPFGDVAIKLEQCTGEPLIVGGGFMPLPTEATGRGSFVGDSTGWVYDPMLVVETGDNSAQLGVNEFSTAALQTLVKSGLGVYTFDVQAAAGARSVTEMLLWDDGRTSDNASLLLSAASPAGSDAWELNGVIVLQLVGSSPSQLRIGVKGPLSPTAGLALMPVDLSFNATEAVHSYSVWLRDEVFSVLVDGVPVYDGEYGDTAQQGPVVSQLTRVTTVVRALDGGDDPFFYAFGGGFASAAFAPVSGADAASVARVSVPLDDDPSCDEILFVPGDGEQFVRVDAALGSVPFGSDIVGWTQHVADDMCTQTCVSTGAVHTVGALGTMGTTSTGSLPSHSILVDAEAPLDGSQLGVGAEALRLFTASRWTVDLGAAPPDSTGTIVPFLIELPSLATVAVGTPRRLGVELTQVGSTTLPFADTNAYIDWQPTYEPDVLCDALPSLHLGLLLLGDDIPLSVHTGLGLSASRLGDGVYEDLVARRSSLDVGDVEHVSFRPSASIDLEGCAGTPAADGSLRADCNLVGTVDRLEVVRFALDTRFVNIALFDMVDGNSSFAACPVREEVLGGVVPEAVENITLDDALSPLDATTCLAPRNSTGDAETKPKLYYLTVRVHTAGSLVSEVTSAGLMVDVTPPAVEEMPSVTLDDTHALADPSTQVERAEEPLAFQASSSEVFAEWRLRDHESGVAESFWSLSAPDGDGEVILNWTSTGRNQYARYDNLSAANLGHNDTFAIRVRAVNGAGLVRETSTLILIDQTPPVAGTVQDGPSSGDADIQLLSDRLYARWGGFFDPETPLETFLVSVGTSPYSPDVEGSGEELIPFEPVGLATGYVRTPLVDSVADVTGARDFEILRLLPFRRYFTCVTVSNKVGLWSNIVCSDGVKLESDNSLALDSDELNPEDGDVTVVLDETAGNPITQNSSSTQFGVAQTASITLPSTLLTNTTTGLIFDNDTAAFEMTAFNSDLVNALRDAQGNESELSAAAFGDRYQDPAVTPPPAFMWGSVAFSMGVYNSRTGEKIEYSGGILPEPVLIVLKLVGVGVSSLEGAYDGDSPLSQLRVYNFTTQEWTNAADTCPPALRFEEIGPANATSVEDLQLTVRVCHFSMYALFVPTASCPSGDTCDGAVAVSLDAGGSWSSGLASSVGCSLAAVRPGTGPCFSPNLAGRDALYRFVAPQAGQYAVRLLSPDNPLASVSVVNDGGVCDAVSASCVGTSSVRTSPTAPAGAWPSTRLVVTADAGDSFLIVVSTSDSSVDFRSASYDLIVTEVGTCVDGERNGAEAGLDCGGPVCDSCGNSRDLDPLASTYSLLPASPPNYNVIGTIATVDGLVYIELPAPRIANTVTVARGPLLNTSTLAQQAAGSPLLAVGDALRRADAGSPIRLVYQGGAALTAQCDDAAVDVFIDSFALTIDYTPRLVTVTFVCPRTLGSDSTRLFVRVEAPTATLDTPLVIDYLPIGVTLVIDGHEVDVSSFPLLVDEDSHAVLMVDEEIADGCDSSAPYSFVLVDGGTRIILIEALCVGPVDDEETSRVVDGRAALRLTASPDAGGMLLLAPPLWGDIIVRDAKRPTIVYGVNDGIPGGTELLIEYTLTGDSCPSRADDVGFADGRWIRFVIPCGTFVALPPPPAAQFLADGLVYRDESTYFDDDDDSTKYSHSLSSHGDLFEGEWNAWASRSKRRIRKRVKACLVTLDDLVTAVLDETSDLKTVSSVVDPLVQARREAQKARFRESSAVDILHKIVHAATHLATARDAYAAGYPVGRDVRPLFDLAMAKCRRAADSSGPLEAVPTLVFIPGDE
jgi:hypothetical protein